MAFATADDVQTKLGRPLTDAQRDAAELAIELVTGLILEVAGEGVEPNPAPTYYKVLVIEKVVQSITNPDGVLSEALGQWSATYSRGGSASDYGIFLSPAEERTVRRIADGVVSETVRTQSILPDVYVTEAP